MGLPSMRCDVWCCRQEDMSVSKCGRSVQPQPPPNSTATGLGKDPPGKISSSDARHVYRVLLPMRRCESSSSSTSTVLRNGSTGQKDHPPFVGRPFRTTPKMVYHNAVGAGAAVFVSTVSQDRPAYPPLPTRLSLLPKQENGLRANPHPTVCPSVQDSRNFLPSVRPAALLPGDSQCGNPQRMACHCPLSL